MRVFYISLLAQILSVISFARYFSILSHSPSCIGILPEDQTNYSFSPHDMIPIIVVCWCLFYRKHFECWFLKYLATNRYDSRTYDWTKYISLNHSHTCIHSNYDISVWEKILHINLCQNTTSSVSASNMRSEESHEDSSNPIMVSRPISRNSRRVMASSSTVRNIDSLQRIPKKTSSKPSRRSDMSEMNSSISEIWGDDSHHFVEILISGKISLHFP